MTPFHAGSIGQSNKILQGPSTDPAAAGVAVVVSGVSGGVTTMGYSALPPLLRPVPNPTATSIVASYPDGSVSFMELDEIAAGAIGLNVLNIDVATTYTYFGGTKLAAWQVNRYNNSTGERLKAVAADNPLVTSYGDAWAARVVLTYAPVTEVDIATGLTGPPGIVISDTPPPDTGVLWLDTSEPSVPPGYVEGADGFRVGGTDGPVWSSGVGSPEGVLSRPVGSLYSRTDGGTGTTLYVKESGTGNTGWVGK